MVNMVIFYGNSISRVNMVIVIVIQYLGLIWKFYGYSIFGINTVIQYSELIW